MNARERWVRTMHFQEVAHSLKVFQKYGRYPLSYELD